MTAERDLLQRVLNAQRRHVLGLDMAPRQRDPAWDEWGGDFPDLRFIVLHMITETACHAGHLDAARELLDRRQWIVL